MGHKAGQWPPVIHKWWRLASVWVECGPGVWFPPWSGWQGHSSVCCRPQDPRSTGKGATAIKDIYCKLVWREFIWCLSMFFFLFIRNDGKGFTAAWDKTWLSTFMSKNTPGTYMYIRVGLLCTCICYRYDIVILCQTSLSVCLKSTPYEIWFVNLESHLFTASLF